MTDAAHPVGGFAAYEFIRIVNGFGKYLVKVGVAEFFKQAHGCISDATVLDKNANKTWRIAFTNSLRNNNIHASLPEYIALMEDSAEDEDVRIAMIKALAWYDKSYCGDFQSSRTM